MSKTRTFFRRWRPVAHLTNILVLMGFAALYQAHSQGYLTPIDVQSINGCRGICTVQPGNFVGTYQVATLPACDNTTTPYGSIAYVTDLGGGANNAKCINGAWQHFTLGIPATNNSTSGTVTVTPLLSAPIQQLTGNILISTTLTMTISTANLYPGYIIYVVAPSSVLGTLLVGVAGTGVTLPLVTGARSAFVWNGTTLVQIQ